MDTERCARKQADRHTGRSLRRRWQAEEPSTAAIGKHAASAIQEDSSGGSIPENPGNDKDQSLFAKPKQKGAIDGVVPSTENGRGPHINDDSGKKSKHPCRGFLRPIRRGSYKRLTSRRIYKISGQMSRPGDNLTPKFDKHTKHHFKTYHRMQKKTRQFFKKEVRERCYTQQSGSGRFM